MEQMNNTEKIKAIFLRVDEENIQRGYIGEIQNTLVDKQSYVGGYIEVISVDGVIDLICNEDGKLLHLPSNRALVGEEGQILDVVVGNIVCVRHDKDGEFTSISEEDMETIKKYLRPCKIIGVRDGYTIVALLPEKDLKEWKDE